MAKTETKISPPSISSSLARRDYHWREITPEEFGQMMAEKLKKMNAKAWMLDVYYSNDQIDRSLIAKWRKEPSSSVTTLALRFSRERGTILDIREEE